MNNIQSQYMLGIRMVNNVQETFHLSATCEGGLSILCTDTLIFYTFYPILIYHVYCTVADPGFPLGGRQCPTQALFGENVSENERIGSRWGAGSPPGSATAVRHSFMFIYIHIYSKVTMRTKL